MMGTMRQDFGAAAMALVPRGMDPLYTALSLFRRRRFEDCVTVCTMLLEKNPYDQAAWTLKMRALTEQLYVDEVDVDEEGIAEMLMDDNAIAEVARPGTSLKKPGTSSGGPSPGVRPTSQSGRPLSGFVRPGTQGGRPGTMEQAIRTPRTAHTARPVTSASGRFVRLGTASMLSSPDGPFINLARLNFHKYAARQSLAKPLFEYIFHHENDVRNALELAALATEEAQFKDWWWKVQLAKCYYRLGLFRDAERQLKSALVQQVMVDTYLYLCKVYVRMDQPLTAIEVFSQGLEHFPGEVSLLTGIARIYDGLNDSTNAVKFYKEVLHHDNTHVEAIACIATHHFYTDQPEIALRFFRRLLQMGVYNSELFCNIGLCCFYAQQYDMTLNCFERAIALASDENMADIWYNIGHVALGIGDIALAYQCFKLALASNNDHAESYNNLGVLEWKKGRVEQARAFFQTAQMLAPIMFEPHYNFAALSEKLGDLQSSYIAARKSVESFPEHMDSNSLLKQLKDHFAML
ncbi:PREDICTED: tetratricopeptide repeat protein 8-like [Branchiostoma belcheri]|uniref:Tetratricopeptide repeat protein 8-like n=1 Tax=Branchiostoma belcheri TaxID=7741 RepID=A0A6P4Z8C7_BRABE|nr:PREDICTED: tetratricopeptide repeat protein 8-like [Branchiostoma belcheri]KAI8484739.1 Tetratricopeptide repeat protein 8 [Branchiostoma belcheri]